MDGVKLRPMVVLETSKRMIGIRFGIEKFPSWMEAAQGIDDGIPIAWHYYFGRRISVRVWR